MITKIINGRILSQSKITFNKSIYFCDGVITDITSDDLPYDQCIDAGGNYISAGFIDVHVHGGGGYDFMDGDVESIINAANFHLNHGTTSIMPTALASSQQLLRAFLDNLRKAIDSSLCQATILGAHIEGPYFSLNQAGAQNPEYIRKPDPSEYMPLIDDYGDIISRWSFAPELEGSDRFCRALLEGNISPSIAHSDAVYEDVKRVYDIGCRDITHLYSGMSTITRENGYRRLGVIESAYLLNDMNVEIIADGKHLPAELLRLILSCKDKEHICLVTDAMRAAGTDQKTSFLGQRNEAVHCIIEDSVAKLPDRRSFAGSNATADRLIRTMVKLVGLPVEQAVSMMTEVPARIFNLTAKGRLSAGCDADIVIFDDNINIKNIISGGVQYGDQDM